MINYSNKNPKKYCKIIFILQTRWVVAETACPWDQSIFCVACFNCAKVLVSGLTEPNTTKSKQFNAHNTQKPSRNSCGGKYHKDFALTGGC